MEKIVITPGTLLKKEFLSVPTSKSHSIRAVLLAGLAQGCSTISHLLKSPDVEAAKIFIQSLGAQIKSDKKGILEIEGVGGKPRFSSLEKETIDCGNSGLLLRLATAIASAFLKPFVFTGDYSLKNLRTSSALIHGLKQLGVKINCLEKENFAPWQVQGTALPQKIIIDGKDSQPVSALLFLAALLPKHMEIQILQPQEKPWVDLTLFWLEKLKVPFQREGYSKIVVHGKNVWPAFIYQVPKDFSSLSFPVVSALLLRQSIFINDIDWQDPQGDKQLFYTLKKMGADLEILPQGLKTGPNSCFKGSRIDMDGMVDALPVLAVLGCFCAGETVLYNAKSCRHKESNRIQTIVQELKKMGAHISSLEDGVKIKESRLQGCNILSSHQDHRIAMSLYVAALTAKIPSRLAGIDCIKKTYPGFLDEYCADRL